MQIVFVYSIQVFQKTKMCKSVGRNDEIVFFLRLCLTMIIISEKNNLLLYKLKNKKLEMFSY